MLRARDTRYMDLIKQIVNKSHGVFLGPPGDNFVPKRPTNADSM